MKNLNLSVHLTLRSDNAKTGPIPVSVSTELTCPDACRLKGAGCYAENGPLALHWRKVTTGERGVPWDMFCAMVETLPEGQLWRHNAAGDLPGDGVDIDHDKLMQLVRASAGKRGFTYTHYPLNDANTNTIWMARSHSFVINLSADNPEHADYLADAGIAPVVTVLPHDAPAEVSFTPAGRRVVVCPATYNKATNCANCGLCAVFTREAIIGFPAHGSRKKTVTILSRSGHEL